MDELDVVVWYLLFVCLIMAILSLLIVADYFGWNRKIFPQFSLEEENENTQDKEEEWDDYPEIFFDIEIRSAISI